MENAENADGAAGRHADSNARQEHSGRTPRLGLDHSIRPGVTCPLIVLVADMSNGAMFLQGSELGPSAYLCPADAGPLRKTLAEAFGDGSHTVPVTGGDAL